MSDKATGKMEVNYVKRIVALHSADVVTRPARGGGFIGFMESIRLAPSFEEAQKVTKAETVKMLESLAQKIASGDEKDTTEQLVDAARQIVAVVNEATKKEGEKGGFTIKHSGDAEGKHSTSVTIPRGGVGATGRGAEEEVEDEDEDEDKDDLGDAPPPGKDAKAGDDDEDVEGEEESSKEAAVYWRERAMRETKKRKAVEARAANAEELAECSKQLAEADIPEDVLPAENLVGLSEGQKKQWIRWGKAFTESSVPVYGMHTPRGAAGAGKSGSMKESLASAGVPTLAAK